MTDNWAGTPSAGVIDASGLPDDTHVPNSSLPSFSRPPPSTNGAPYGKTEADGTVTYYAPSGEVIGHKPVNGDFESSVVTSTPDADGTVTFYSPSGQVIGRKTANGPIEYGQPDSSSSSTAPATTDGWAGTPADQATAPAAPPETTLGGLAGAATRGLAPVALGTAAGAGLGALAGGVGAIPGAAAGAAAGALTQFVGDPVVGAINDAFGTHYTKPTDALSHLLSSIGVAEPRTAAEKVVEQAAQGAGAGLATAGLGSVMSGAPGVTGAIGETLAANPGTQAIASASGSGAGEVAHQSGAGPVGQLLATLGGAAGGAGAAVGGSAAARGITDLVTDAAGSSARPLNDIGQSFARSDVPALPADVGGHFTRMLTAGTSKLTLGGIPIEAAAQRSIDAARAARSAIADRIGNVVRPKGEADTAAAGLAAQQGVRNWLATTAGRASKFYHMIPIPDEAASTLNNTRDAFTRINEGLPSNPELSELLADPQLQKWEAAIKGTIKNEPTGVLDTNGKAITKPVTYGGHLSWKDLKAFRSKVGEMIDQPSLQEKSSKKALRDLYGALSEDMKATAAKQGPKALKTFTRANAYYAARAKRIENVLSNILGDDLHLNGEAAFRQIERWSAKGGNAAAVAQALRSMSSDEASQVRATMFDKLGTPTKGEGFSATLFGNHWNSLSMRAKSALFPGADYRQSIDDLVRITKAQAVAQKLGQGSPTAHLLQAGNAISHGVAFLGHLFTNPLAALAIGAESGVEYGTGKLLASPRFARWLASAPAKPNPAARLAHVNRLTAIATAEPTIANDVLHLQERLAQAFTNSPQSLAAEKPDNRSGEPPQQGKPEGAAYHAWLKQYGIREDPTYDTRAAFEAGIKPSARGHLNDEFKLPNHPTFSDESVHNGEGGKQGGKWIQTGGATAQNPDGVWTFKASPWNLQNMSKSALKTYFDHTEPGMTIIFPDGDHYTGHAK